MSQDILFLFNNLEITALERRRTEHRFLGTRDSRDKKQYYHEDLTKRVFVVMESLSCLQWWLYTSRYVIKRFKDVYTHCINIKCFMLALYCNYAINNYLDKVDGGHIKDETMLVRNIT